MKTRINIPLETLGDAVVFLQELVRNEESWHMDDDVRDCLEDIATEDELEYLELRSGEIWDIASRNKEFCPHEIMLDELHRLYPTEFHENKWFN